MERSLWMLGDSVLKGIIYDTGKNRHFLLGPSPAQQIAGQLHVPLHNHSVMGATLDRAQRILDRKQPGPGDFVVLGYGGNDCDFDWARVAAQPDQPHQCHTPLPVFLGLYEEVIRRIRALGAVPVAITLPPLDAQRYFRWVSRGLDKRAILRFLGDVQQIYRWQELYSHNVAMLAREVDCRIIDIREAFLRQRNLPQLLCDDGIHPNEQGYRLMVREALEAAGRAGLLATA